MYISADCRIVSTFLLAESVLSSSGLSTAPQRPTRQAVSHNQDTKSSLIQPPPPIPPPRNGRTGLYFTLPRSIVSGVRLQGNSAQQQLLAALRSS